MKTKLSYLFIGIIIFYMSLFFTGLFKQPCERHKSIILKSRSSGELLRMRLESKSMLLYDILSGCNHSI